MWLNAAKRGDVGEAHCEVEERELWIGSIVKGLEFKHAGHNHRETFGDKGELVGPHEIQQSQCFI